MSTEPITVTKTTPGCNLLVGLVVSGVPLFLIMTRNSNMDWVATCAIVGVALFIVYMLTNSVEVTLTDEGIEEVSNKGEKRLLPFSQLRSRM